MNREEKKLLSKTRKMSLEFSESMYIEMEGFVGKRQIFGRATDVVDSDRVAPPVARYFVRSPPIPRPRSDVGVGSPITNAMTASESPTHGTPGDDTPGSTGCKRKAVGTDNLVNFVKDLNYEYLTCVEAQDKDKRAWRSEVLAFDTAREIRIAQKETEVTNMDKKLYELEVERTKNLGNMITALLMLASSMNALTRFCALPSSLELWLLFKFFVYSGGLLYGWNFEHVLNSPKCPSSPFVLLIQLFLRSEDPLVLEVENTLLRLYVASRCRALVEDGNPLEFDPTSGLC